jgi:hypothetical protein
MRLTDPVFGEIEFHTDAWDSIVPFEFAPAGTLDFAVHVWADAFGPTDTQRRTFDELRRRYAGLRPRIAEALVSCHPGPSSAMEVDRSLKRRGALGAPSLTTAWKWYRTETALRASQVRTRRFSGRQQPIENRPFVFGRASACD